jgi:GntR family transcriptional repressor for pyruvate dehydrogenase complex
MRVMTSRFRVLKAPEMLADRLRKQIVSGDLKDGDILPTESILTERFGVSRPTIREAYRILEAQRLITVTRGAKGGAVVHAPSSDLLSNYLQLLLQTERVTIREVYQARNAFEPMLAQLVAASGGEAAALELRQCIEEEERCIGDPETFSDAVIAFHRTLVMLSGNRPLLHLYDALSHLVQIHQANVIKKTLQSGDEVGPLKDAARGLKSQAKLIDYIQAGDNIAAEKHWREHMINASNAWLQGSETTTVLDLTLN